MSDIISKAKENLADVFGSMRFAIFLTFSLCMISLVFILGGVLTASSKNKLWNQKVSTLQSTCDMIADRITESGFRFSDSSDTLSTEIDQFASLIDGRIIVIDQSFRIVKDTFDVETNRYFMTQEVTKVMSGEEITPRKINNQYMEIFYPIQSSSKEQVSGVLCIIASCQDIVEMGNYMTDLKSRLNTLLISVFLVIGFGIAVFITRKFKLLNKSVSYIAEGHTDEQVRVVGFSEMKKTARSFNEILGKMQILEDSRQEFVSNVSHELKTPITSIKVLAESLLMQPDADASLYREFMGDIVEEIDRENKIITDLLALVKMDKKVANMNIQTLNINELIESIVKRLKPIAQKREIEIGFESFRPVLAEVDEVKLTLAISNLIENGIKYNVDHGWVHVSLNADHKFFYLKVEDSGEGIAEEFQEHIFERFYRVDKARSRETGGTGLGLAITRDVALLHKGAIKVHSNPGEGTTFTMRIPLTYTA